MFARIALMSLRQHHWQATSPVALSRAMLMRACLNEQVQGRVSVIRESIQTEPWVLVPSPDRVQMPLRKRI